MLEGWYCRTLANEQAEASSHHRHHSQQDDGDNDQNIGDSGSDDSQDGPGGPMAITANRPMSYKEQYKYLKQKLKFLIYENEFFQDALRTSQRRLLKVSRDRSFLLDRLLQYEKPEGSSSESDETESSDESSKVETKKRKYDSSQSSTKNQNTTKKKKMSQKNSKSAQNQSQQQTTNQSQLHTQLHHQMQEQGHMTAEEVERHLQSRQSITELVPERAPPTVPNEMFSNEPSLDSESNDQMIETSPSNIGEDCISVDMNVKSEYNIKTEYQS